jgi:hypothetical protein
MFKTFNDFIDELKQGPSSSDDEFPSTRLFLPFEKHELSIADRQDQLIKKYHMPRRQARLHAAMESENPKEKLREIFLPKVIMEEQQYINPEYYRAIHSTNPIRQAVAKKISPRLEISYERRLQNVVDIFYENAIATGGTFYRADNIDEYYKIWEEKRKYLYKRDGSFKLEDPNFVNLAYGKKCLVEVEKYKNLPINNGMDGYKYELALAAIVVGWIAQNAEYLKANNVAIDRLRNMVKALKNEKQSYYDAINNLWNNRMKLLSVIKHNKNNNLDVLMSYSYVYDGLLS